MNKFLTKLLGFVSLLLSFSQAVAKFTKNRWVTTGVILVSVLIGAGFYHWWKFPGLLIFMGIILVSTMILAGLNKIADPVKGKIEARLARLEKITSNCKCIPCDGEKK